MRLFAIILILLAAGSANAINSDSVIVVIGSVIDGTTKAPVKARVYYKSLPYGNKVGIINSADFQFWMFDSDHYSIQVDAAGYEVAKYIIDPTEADANQQINRVIELVPTSSTLGTLIRLESLIFEVNRARITPQSHNELDGVVTMMKANPNMIIQLEGHTDTKGNPQKNLELSQDRVDAVKKYLVSKGIKKQRILTKAFGGTKPVVTDDAEEAHRLNRRVELRIISN